MLSGTDLILPSALGLKFFVFFPQEAQNSHVYWVSVSLKEEELRRGAWWGRLGGGGVYLWGAGLCNAGVSLFCILVS